MSFESAFLSMFPSTISVSTRSAHNNYGEPTYTGSAVTYAARIVQGQGFVRNPSGETVAVTHELWVRSTAAQSITVDDRITLPSSCAQDTTPQILRIQRIPDADGIHHTKIWLGQRPGIG